MKLKIVNTLWLLDSSWFTKFCTLCFCYFDRGCGLNPGADRFFIFYYVLVMFHAYGELQTVAFLAVFNKSSLAQSVSMLLNTASILYATGLIK